MILVMSSRVRAPARQSAIRLVAAGLPVLRVVDVLVSGHRARRMYGVGHSAGVAAHRVLMHDHAGRDLAAADARGRYHAYPFELELLEELASAG